jgi:hypothetical protein
MRVTPSLLLILSLSLSVAAQEAPDTTRAFESIEWSSTRRLTFEDFRKVPENPLTVETVILHLGVNSTLDSLKLPQLKTFNGQVTTVFYPTFSWIDKSNRTGLQYSNTVFDIYEWISREFRKRLNENRARVLDGKVREISEELNREFTLILEAYDAETKSASNLLEQMKWESLISQKLQALAAYCKSCGESKMK